MTDEPFLDTNWNVGDIITRPVQGSHERRMKIDSHAPYPSQLEHGNVSERTGGIRPRRGHTRHKHTNG